MLRHGCSAKELTVQPKRSVTIKDSAAYGIIVTQGYGRFGKLPVSTPSMIRFGQMTEDELFVSAAAATKGVTIENLSESDPLVVLKHFGPGNPDAEPLRNTKKLTKTHHVDHEEQRLCTNTPPSITRCGPASSARAGPAPSRRSISTRCSTSPRRPRSTASSSTASICSCSIRTSASTRRTTTSRSWPTRSAGATSSSARWSRRCGRRPAAARRWAATTSARRSSRRCGRPAASRRS